MSEIKDPEIKSPEKDIDNGKETGGETSKETKDNVIELTCESGGFSCTAKFYEDELNTFLEDLKKTESFYKSSEESVGGFDEDENDVAFPEDESGEETVEELPTVDDSVGFSENAGARSATREVSMHGNRWKAVGAAAQLSLALLSSSVGGKFIAAANPNLAPIVEVADYANEVLEEAYDPTKEDYINEEAEAYRRSLYVNSLKL